MNMINFYRIKCGEKCEGTHERVSERRSRVSEVGVPHPQQVAGVATHLV